MSKPIRKQRWSNIDGIGLLNGLGIWDAQYKELKYIRRPFDSPIDLKNRILRENENKTDTTQQGLLNGLCNEINLDSYNLQKKTIFELTNAPSPSGSEGVQDIRAYFNSSGVWYEVIPQVWASGYVEAKNESYGFTVWQNDRFNTVPEIKNFRYSTIAEILSDEIPDESPIKFEYYVDTVDEDNRIVQYLYTDMDHPNDSDATRFLYRKPQTTGDIRVYTLDNIPEDLRNEYYYDSTTGEAKDLLYTIKDHIDRKYKHKWGEFKNNECIWDVHKYYGSGHIPSFYDAVTPAKYNGDVLVSGALLTANTHTGGVESYSDALYFTEIEEVDTGSGLPKWYPVVYPGRFYLAGIPFYLFENPQTANLTFVNGSSILPEGLERHHHVIMTQSGYYDTAWNDVDLYFNNKIYEEYSYPCSPSDLYYYSYIYRYKPYIPIQTGYQNTLSYGEYTIDFDSGYIITDTGITDTFIVWDEIDTPSGTIVNYDLNPLNEQYLTLDRYFMYLTLNNV